MSDNQRWISTDDLLPPEGRYVLARHERGTWRDKDDQDGVNYVVVKLVRGISEKERNALAENNPRKRLYRKEDQHGNNLFPYVWDSFGPDCFFGQDVKFWSEIERIKTEQ